MSTLTKEWLKQKIAEMEAARDEIPFGLNEYDSNELQTLRIALASLEAEPVAEVCEGFNLRYIGHGPAPKSGLRIGDRLYTAPPAPMLPDESLSAMEEVLRISDRDHEAWHKAKSAIADCRAAMLQGKESEHV
ncbi:hypothetical protein NHG68_19610 [Enterobacter sp. Z1]|uniref:hypothetical protein n=1 Tax=Enterobacter sp. Z1 TaxID=2561927 RepID=UPI0011DFD8D7|nr:hypothetical protein [Enterobacter sp. Z1]TYD01639.1 hypothetical protein E4M14_021815 [Enterobacter sp. Z1]USX31081.1 hypothetical protein NHG68_19610 [Enterobacter sp. Z1]